MGSRLGIGLFILCLVLCSSFLVNAINHVKLKGKSHHTIKKAKHSHTHKNTKNNNKEEQTPWEFFSFLQEDFVSGGGSAPLHMAYSATDNTIWGDQDYSGSLGLDFQVNTPIRILGFGAFDHSGEGFNTPKTVWIVDLTNPNRILRQVTFSPGKSAPIKNGFRWQILNGKQVLELTPGKYSVIANGFNGKDLNGNRGTVPHHLLDDLNGAISFIGAGRYGDPNSFPVNVDGGPADRYLAGSFLYDVGQCGDTVLSNGEECDWSANPAVSADASKLPQAYSTINAETAATCFATCQFDSQCTQASYVQGMSSGACGLSSAALPTKAAKTAALNAWPRNTARCSPLNCPLESPALNSVSVSDVLPLSQVNSYAPVPRLTTTISVDVDTYVFAAYLITTYLGDSHLVVRLDVDGVTQPSSQTIQGNTVFGTVSGNVILKLSPGVHTFTVKYRTPVAPNVGGPSESDWRTTRLQVLRLPGITYVLDSPVVQLASIGQFNTGNWYNFPQLSKTTAAYSTPASYIAIYEANGPFGGRDIIFRLLVDGVEQPQTRCHQGNTVYGGCTATWIGILSANVGHTFVVQYKSSVAVVWNMAEDWQSARLDILRLPSAVTNAVTIAPQAGIYYANDNAWHTMPGLSIDHFVLTKKSVVLITYQISLITQNTHSVHRLIIDNVEEPLARGIAGNTLFGTISVTVFVTLAAGSHSIQVQYRSPNGVATIWPTTSEYSTYALSVLPLPPINMPNEIPALVWYKDCGPDCDYNDCDATAVASCNGGTCVDGFRTYTCDCTSIKKGGDRCELELFSGAWNCDDYSYMYIDGKSVANQWGWTYATQFSMGAKPGAVIEIRGVNGGGPGGIIGTFDYMGTRFITDESWECSADKGSTWSSPAPTSGPNGADSIWKIRIDLVSTDAKWIWQRDFYARDGWCRTRLPYNAFKADDKVMLPVKNTNTAFCSRSSGSTTWFFGTICGNGNVLWDHMYTIDPRDEFNGKQESCAWARSLYDANWQNTYLGNCNSAPTAVPELSTKRASAYELMAIETDQCARNPCDKQATCKWNRNGPLPFTCTCNPGYTGTGLVCKEINACETNPCDKNAACTRTAPGQRSCQCNSGYSAVGERCVEIDNCAAIPPPCHSLAKCTKTGPGTSSCKCFDGYQGNGVTSCEIIDLCAKTPPPCDANAVCSMAGLGYTCKCNDGYDGNGKTCTEINACLSGPCDVNAKCSRTGPNKYSCKCNEFFSGDGRTCKEIDVCNPSPCNAHATCTKIAVGKKKCTCNQGYEPSDDDGCNAINACLKNPCDANAICTNTGPGTYTCQCKQGYSGDGVKGCAEINMCATGPCDPQAVCDKTGPGTFTCTCKQGYTGDGKTCVEIDACASNPCDPQASCSKTGPNRYTCQCGPGYKGDGRNEGSKCSEIDMCLGDPCDKNAICAKTGPGKFTCTCRQGFKGTGDVCEEINLCATANPCDAHGLCTKTGPGTASCKCMKGYEGDGKVCSPIDMCLRNPCDQNANCKSTGPGVFSCSCRDGYVGDGLKCDEQDLCPTRPCDSHATCAKTGPGLYSCTCQKGYKGDGKSCEEIDPCGLIPPPCDKHATCQQAGPGGFACTCNTGYSLSDNGRECIEQDACHSAPCHKWATCSKTGPGLYLCACNTGYSGDGKSCDEIDDCANGPCDANAECKKTGPGSHVCTCKPGYKGSGETCNPIDACLTSPCDPHATCTSTGPGTYTCVCDKGYIGAGDSCQEEDACVNKPCNENAVCYNTGAGTYHCQCLSGYEGDGVNSCQRLKATSELRKKNAEAHEERLLALTQKLDDLDASVGFDPTEQVQDDRVANMASKVASLQKTAEELVKTSEQQATLLKNLVA